jgi:hypothetical protein
MIFRTVHGKMPLIIGPKSLRVFLPFVSALSKAKVASKRLWARPNGSRIG